MLPQSLELRAFDGKELAKVAKGAKVPANVVNTILAVTPIAADINDRPLFSLENRHDIAAAIIPILAYSAGTREEIPTEVIEQCGFILLEQYRKLSQNEIKAAYRLWATNSLPKQDGSSEVWGGQFSIRQFGAVLSAYFKVRNRVRAQLINLNHEKVKQEIHKLKIAESKATFPQRLKEFTGSWEEIPIEWYDMAVEMGMLDLTAEQKREAFASAKAEFVIAAEADRMHRVKMAQRTGEAAPVMSLLQDIGQRFPRMVKATDEEKTVVIAKQISVYLHLIKKL